MAARQEARQKEAEQPTLERLTETFSLNPPAALWGAVQAEVHSNFH